MGLVYADWRRAILCEGENEVVNYHGPAVNKAANNVSALLL